MPRRKVIQAAAVFLAVFAVPAAAHFGYIFLRLGDNFFHRVAEGNPSPYLTYKRPIPLCCVSSWGNYLKWPQFSPCCLRRPACCYAVSTEAIIFRAPLLLLWLPSLINISALYWGMIYRLRYSVLLLPAVAIFGSLVLTSAMAKKRAVLLLLVLVAMVTALALLVFSQNGSGREACPGPGALLLPVAGLILL